MSSTRGKRIVQLRHWDAERALEGLNRLTGLRFVRWPESLVEPCGEGEQTSEGTEAELAAPPDAAVQG